MSSFAYQGTNSHALVVSAQTPAVAAPPAGHWRTTRMWYQVTCHPLLVRFAPAVHTRGVVIESSLRRASLDFLHGCKVLGRRVVPAAVLLEAAAAAGGTLLGNGQSRNPVAVADAAFGAPVNLSVDSDGRLICAVDPAQGGVSMSSIGAAGFVGHMQAALCALHPRAASPAPPTPRLKKKPSPVSATLIRAAASPPATAFASVLAHNLHHAGYWLHPAVAEASHQLAVALRAPATSALLVAAVGMFGFGNGATLGAQAAAGCLVGWDGRADAWVAGGAGPPALAISGTQFTSLKSWAEHRAAGTAAFIQPVFQPHARRASARAAASAPTLSAVVAQLSAVVAELLGAQVAPDQPLMAAGLDRRGGA